VEHALEVRVGVELVGVRRLGPARDRRLDPLRLHVGALDQTDRHRRTARRNALPGPGVDALLRRKGIRQVGLERDPRTDILEARARQGLDEGLHRDLEIPILLHVEVDELRDLGSIRAGEAGLRRGTVEQFHSIAEDLDRVASGDRRELRVERRDLDRDHLDHRELQHREVRLQAALGFVLPEQRFAEDVHVHADPVGAPPFEVLAQVLRLGREDHVGGLSSQLALHERHRDAGEIISEGLETLEHGAVDRAEEARHALDVECARAQPAGASPPGSAASRHASADAARGRSRAPARLPRGRREIPGARSSDR